jgi:exodeoxyribonuclease VII small subunit
MPKEYENFHDVKTRLDEIVDAVSDDSLSLDELLPLYEEAVKLGSRASELIEQAQEDFNAAAGEGEGAGEGTADVGAAGEGANSFTNEAATDESGETVTDAGTTAGTDVSESQLR